MNATYVQRGEYLDYTPAADVSAGDIVVRGALAAVAKLDIKAGTLGALSVTGVYDIVKDAIAFSAGDAVRWDAANGRAVKEGGAALGVAVSDAAISDGTVRVLLQGSVDGSGGSGEDGEEEDGGTAPSAAIDDLTLTSVTAGGSWSGGDGNINEVTDLKAIRDRINAVLAALRSHGIVAGA